MNTGIIRGINFYPPDQAESSPVHINHLRPATQRRESPIVRLTNDLIRELSAANGKAQTQDDLLNTAKQTAEKQLRQNRLPDHATQVKDAKTLTELFSPKIMAALALAPDRANDNLGRYARAVLSSVATAAMNGGNPVSLITAAINLISKLLTNPNIEVPAITRGMLARLHQEHEIKSRELAIAA